MRFLEYSSTGPQLLQIANKLESWVLRYKENSTISKYFSLDVREAHDKCVVVKCRECREYVVSKKVDFVVHLLREARWER